MLRRVAPIGDLKRANLGGDPQHWSDSELLLSSLSNLSKSLSRDLSNRRTLEVYFKWLEVHRRNPSDLTKSWDNTLLHWSQALKARGFEKEDVMDAIKEWKVENGPFESTVDAWGQRRCPPISYDIAKAWAEAEIAKSHILVLSSGLKHANSWRPFHGSGGCRAKPDDFEGSPAGDYVCNRCGTKGHFLQACPTNMDPSYDNPPSMDYRCPICCKYGLHYKSLCPLNTDPFCIIQKRRTAGVDTPGDSSSGILRDWQRKIHEHENGELLRGRPLSRSWGRDSEETSCRPSPNWSPDESMNYSPNYSPSYSPNTSKSEDLMKRIKELNDMKMRIVQSDHVGTEDVLMIKKNLASTQTSEKRTRMSSPDNSKIQARREVNDKSPSPTKSEHLRKKLRQIESYETHAAQGGKLDWQAKVMIEKKSDYQTCLNTLETNIMDLGDIDAEMEDRPRLALRQNAPSSKRSKPNHKYHRTSSPSSETMDLDSEEHHQELKLNIISHNDFVKKLIERHPEMSQVVNPARWRKTALDMWDEDDDRRMKMAELSRVMKSPSFGPSESDSDDNKDDAMQVDRDGIAVEDGDKGSIWKPFRRSGAKPSFGWS